MMYRGARAFLLLTVMEGTLGAPDAQLGGSGRGRWRVGERRGCVKGFHLTTLAHPSALHARGNFPIWPLASGCI